MGEKVKITFGLQDHHIKRIEEYSKYYDNLDVDSNTDSNFKGIMKYSIYFWEKLGEEFGWDPFTLALYYFKYEQKIREKS